MPVRTLAATESPAIVDVPTVPLAVKISSM
jgi:hypothetical protein